MNEATKIKAWDAKEKLSPEEESERLQMFLRQNQNLHHRIDHLESLSFTHQRKLFIMHELIQYNKALTTRTYVVGGFLIAGAFLGVFGQILK